MARDLELVTKLEDIRKTKFAKIQVHKIMALSCFILFLISLIIIFSLRIFNLIFLIFGMLFICGVFLALYFGGKKKVSQELKEIFYPLVLQNFFTNVAYISRLGISLQRINALNVIKRPDDFKHEDYIKGEYQGLQFEMSEVEFIEVTTDSEGNTSSSTYFRGRWFIFKINNVFHNTLKVIERGIPSFNDLKEVKSESIDFNKKYRIKTTNTDFAFFILTPKIMQRLLDMDPLKKNKEIYCFSNNEVHIALGDNKDHFEFVVSKPITLESIELLIKELDIIPELIELFSLNSNKFDIDNKYEKYN
ncbi:MAG: DUF3137 domain-containing protein [Bacillales bacterium]|jgi:Ca2+/Na+ antiporter|nr:DUF3137 domain-containing protein [Bacillales bacterium]